MKKMILAFSMIAVVACGGGSSVGSAGAGSMVGGSLSAGFAPDQSSPGNGSAAMAVGPAQSDSVTVQVNVVGVIGLRSATFDVIFDPDAVEFVGWSPGNALESSGQVPLYVAASNTPGVLTVGVDLIGPGSVNVTGTSRLVGLIFRAKQAGTHPLTFQSEALRDATLAPLSISWFAGALTAS